MITYKNAKKYLDMRWSIMPVILTEKNGKIEKKPAVPWKVYQDRRPTEQELHKWFDNGKYNGIGLITGEISRVVVLDIDDLAKAPDVDSLLTVDTISGGKHLYFKWIKELRNDARIRDIPVDFRGDGGFVVLPPSGIGDKRYKWDKTIEPMYLDPLPEEIEKQLHKRETFSPVREPYQVPEGARNMTAAQMAGKITNAVIPNKLDSIGFLAFQQWNNDFCKPPLDEQELLSVWQSILTKHRREAPDNPILLYTGEKALLQYEHLEEQYGSGITTGFTGLDNYFKFLPEQLYLISAPTHQGKTTLALNMASRIAQKGSPVLFASLEQGVFIAPRVKTILDDDFPEKLTILTSTQTVGIEPLVRTIEAMEQQPKLVVIDHLHFIKKRGENVTSSIDDMIVRIQNMAKQLQVPVLVIAHVRKLNGDRPADLDDLRDSSSLSQVPAVVMLIHREKNPDDFQAKSYLAPYGSLFIAKNRIQGKTGVISFTLKDSGEFTFS